MAINNFINQINQQGSNSHTKEPKTIDCIAAGETFEHDGPVIVAQSIGAGATVKIKNGGLCVNGTVGDNARIKTEGSSGANINVNISGNVIITNGAIVNVNGKTIVGGFTQSSAKSAEAAQGITLNGPVGESVTCVSSVDVKLKQIPGENFGAQANRDVELPALSQGGIIEASRDAEIDGDIADGCRITAARDIEAGCVNNSTLNAGRDIDCGEANGQSTLSAGRDIKVRTADQTVQINAGRKVKIGQLHSQQNEQKPDPKNRFDIF